MRTRRAGFPPKSAFALAALLGVALAVAPALASSEPASTVKAVQTSLYSYAWSPTEATVSSGGGVAFANSTAGVPHGIVWTSAVKPSCSASVPDGEGGKETSSASSWSGSCTFATAGTYTFRCSVHSYMTGTVTVSGPATTTTGTTGTPTETAPTPTTTASAPPPVSERSPLQGSVSRALKLPKNQRGGAVRGSLAVSQAGAGGRLEVDLIAKSASLARHAPSRHLSAGHLVVGRLLRSSLPAGKLSFAVALDARAKSALHRHHRLALSVKIALMPPHGSVLAFMRNVIVRL